MNDLTPATAPARPAPAPLATPLGWLRTEIDRLFDDFGGPARSIFNFGAALGPVPALEVSDQGKEYRLTVELPGLEDKDVDVSIADGILTISGEKRDESQHKDEGLQVLAISMDKPSTVAEARRVAQSFSFPVALQSDADFKGLGRIWRMPSTFVVDAQGILRRNGSVGEPTVDLASLEAQVTPLLRKP